MYRSIFATLVLATLSTATIDRVDCFAQEADIVCGFPVFDPPLADTPPTPRSEQQHQHAKVLAKAKTALEKGHRPTDVHDFEKSTNEVKIEKAFKESTSLTFIETPLEEACNAITDKHNIPILIDRRALEEIGLTPDTPVNLSMKKVRLRSFLRMMLREIDLTYHVTNDVLLITTIDAAESTLATKMFKLDRRLRSDKDTLIESIQTAVVPETWETLGGPSALICFQDVLIVSAPDDVIYQVDTFLSKLTSAIKQE